MDNEERYIEKYLKFFFSERSECHRLYFAACFNRLIRMFLIYQISSVSFSSFNTTIHELFIQGLKTHRGIVHLSIYIPSVKTDGKI